MNKIIYEPGNGVQPWAIYLVKGEDKVFRTAFSTKKRAQEWIDRYGDGVFDAHGRKE
ncbi:MAG TPA: hypothetical protein VIG74_05140 [Alphaproteobacteria bacterium]|jgi:hypothetical protein